MFFFFLFFVFFLFFFCFFFVFVFFFFALHAMSGLYLIICSQYEIIGCRVGRYVKIGFYGKNAKNAISMVLLCATTTSTGRTYNNCT